MIITRSINHIFKKDLREININHLVKICAIILSTICTHHDGVPRTEEIHVHLHLALLGPDQGSGMPYLTYLYHVRRRSKYEICGQQDLCKTR